MANKARIRKWIEALRSGEFTQTRARLRGKGNERCCLGVACDVFKRETGQGRWRGEDFVVDETSLGTLPEMVQKWFGLPDDNPPITSRQYAASANDDGKSFDYIADKLEKKYL